MAAEGKTVLYGIWVVTILCLLLFIPRSKARLAWVAFLFKQAITWPLGLYVVDVGWIQYPVRLLENANYTSVTFEYLFYPAICSFFNVYFPEGRSLSIRALFYAAFCSALTLVELWVLHHTEFIRYIHWNAFLTWGSLFITFYLSRKFCLWFFTPHSMASKN